MTKDDAEIQIILSGDLNNFDQRMIATDSVFCVDKITGHLMSQVIIKSTSLKLKQQLSTTLTTITAPLYWSEIQYHNVIDEGISDQCQLDSLVLGDYFPAAVCYLDADDN